MWRVRRRRVRGLVGELWGHLWRVWFVNLRRIGCRAVLDMVRDCIPSLLARRTVALSVIVIDALMPKWDEFAGSVMAVSKAVSVSPPGSMHSTLSR